ncbi:hypothetical protein ABZ412_35350 [Nocardia sp. NPDC005746]|uniref:hypothetical protein n=1 Tax=Nocardia sp. NPDC005746 TaxID=3157062 RepID=UPI0033E428AE
MAPAQGVTATSITLGVAGTDPAQLEAAGVQADNGPATKDLYTAWIAAQNKTGGAGGRQIQFAFQPFLPTGPAAAQAACVALSKDQAVFAAIGIFTGDTPLCFTQTEGVPYIGLWGQSADRDAKSTKAPFLAVEMADDRQRKAGVQALLDQGLLKGRKVALYWEAQDDAVTKNVVKPLLQAAGVDVVAETPLANVGTDQSAQNQALDTVVEKMKSSGADTVLNTSNFSNIMVAFQRKGWLPQQILATSQQALSTDVMATTGITPATMAPLTVAASYAPTKAELAADANLTRCVQEYNDAFPGSAVDMAKVSLEILSGIAHQCAAFELFVQVTDNVGANITLDGWRTAAEGLGTLNLAGVPIGSLGPGKHSVGDAVGVYKFDASTSQMLPTGPAIAATK